MPLHELHPYTKAEVARLPRHPGVFVLFQIENPVHAGGAENLRSALRAAKGRFPGATHFSVEMVDGTDRILDQRVQEIRAELKLVGKAGFCR
jgi:hypothetical protein